MTQQPFLPDGASFSSFRAPNFPGGTPVLARLAGAFSGIALALLASWVTLEIAEALDTHTDCMETVGC